MVEIHRSLFTYPKLIGGVMPLYPLISAAKCKKSPVCVFLNQTLVESPKDWWLPLVGSAKKSHPLQGTSQSHIRFGHEIFHEKNLHLVGLPLGRASLRSF